MSKKTITKAEYTELLKQGKSPKEIFDSVSFFYDGFAGVELDGKWGFINQNNQFIVEPKFDEVRGFTDGFANVVKDGKNYRVNNKGYIISTEFVEGIAKIQQDSRWGFMSENGEIIVEPRFDWVSNFKNGFAHIELQNKFGIVKHDGTYLTELIFDDVGSFSDGFALVTICEKYVFIANDGKYLIKPKFDTATNFKNGFADVCLDGEEYTLDKVGYLTSKNFVEGFAKINFQDKWGFINKETLDMIEPKYDKINNFSEGFAGVCLMNSLQRQKWGFVKEDGTYLVEPRFNEITDFKDGLAIVVQNEKYYNVDKNGYLISTEFVEGFATVEKDGEWGFMSKNGEIIVEPRFDEIYDFEYGIAIAELNRQFFGITKYGEIFTEYEMLKREWDQEIEIPYTRIAKKLLTNAYLNQI